MKNNAYLKTTYRDIKHSFGRFIAVILIIFMGVLVFVGIKSVAPDLNQTGNQLFDQSHLSDVQLRSTQGFVQKDKELVEKLKGTQAELGYSFPYVEKKKDKNLQVYSYDKNKKQNQLTLVEGKLPQKADQAMVDEQLKTTYHMGDKLKIKDQQLKNQELTITGFVKSPIYVEDSERGTTNVGDGGLDGFLYLPQSNFDHSTFSIMYLTFSDLPADFFSEDYKVQLTHKLDRLDDLLAKRKVSRKKEVVAEGLAKIQEKQDSLNENQKKLAQGQKKIAQAKSQWEQQQEQLTLQKQQIQAALGKEAATRQLQEPQKQLMQAQNKIKKQQAKLADNQKKIDKGQREIDQASKKLKNMALPVYLTTDRQSNPGFNQFSSLPDRIDAIGNVFPVFFFLIAILITFTTITRMVEENRKEIGTLKALGYHNAEIASKYLLYAFLTAVIGTTLGIVVGTKSLPPIVFIMLKQMFIFTAYSSNYWMSPILIAIAASLIATVGSACYVLVKDLREKPTALLQPKAPKAGQRILLERIRPFWNRLGFIQKVTGRNLFRYKARMLLTVMGIAGCSGLIVAGFGLKASIAAPAVKQYTAIDHYQAIVSLTDKGIDRSQDVKQQLDKNRQVKSYLAIYSDQVTLKKKKISNQTATLLVSEQPTELRKYLSFQTADKDKSPELSNKGAIISQRLAQAYQLSVGDKVKIQNTAGDEATIKIAAITNNYLGHKLYMSQAYFDQVSPAKKKANSYLVKTEKMNGKEENRLADDLEKTDEVVNTTFIRRQIEKQQTAIASLLPVVIIFIVLSGTLAFVVLYNLTNINISERERELATIKVLGFFDREVTMYIVRENVIFTILGILLGFGVGKLLTWFIILMASSDLLVFPLVVPFYGYVVAVVMTAVFSGIVMGITHFKLKEIDMIGALKSNE